MEKQLSHFSSIRAKNPETIEFQEFIMAIQTGMIKGESYVELFERIRSTPSKEDRNSLKKKLPAVTLSAICKGGHKKENIEKPSGYLQVDIDNITNIEELKSKFKSDPNFYLVFVSPGGNGLKVVMFIGDCDHKEAFLATEKYFQSQYNIKIDPSIKDESRLCYYSYDPEIHVNPDVKLFEHKEYTFQEKSQLKSEIENIIGQIMNKKVDLTSTYENWRNIGFALANELGAEGEEFFKQISQFYPGYNAVDCTDQYQKCLNSKGSGITIRSFFKLAKENGLKIPATNSQKKETIFYYPVLDKDGEIKDVKIDYTKWIDLLYNLGIRRFDIEKDFTFVKITDQVITEVSVTLIQDDFVKYLEGLPQQLTKGVTKEYLISKFYRNPSHYFCENRLNLLRPKSPYIFNTDTKDECFIYFQNGFVSCTKNQYEFLPYNQLKGYIWQDQIVKKDFTKLEIVNVTPQEKGVFSSFIYNISGKDQERYESFCTILGYLLHSYYIGKLKAVVLTDSKISDVPSGRTGKTLVCQALSYVKKYTEVNGKDFDTTNKHKYQQADLDTQLIHLNDVKKNFIFENLFNDITEGCIVDKKNQKPFRIQSKFIISTNQTISIEGASAVDRAIEFELADHYNDTYSPQDEFGHWFFRDWEPDEWSRFFNFLMGCISSYLQQGVIPVPVININRRKLLTVTSPEFVEFMDGQIKSSSIQAGKEYDKKILYELFIKDYPDFAEEKKFRQRNFTKGLQYFAKLSGNFGPFDADKHERKSGDVRYIIFPPP
jgi:hypothetical protein